MKIESHKMAIKESIETIRESIQKGLQNRQRTIGFHCSAASADLLEAYLHQKNLIDPGANIKHDWFSSLEKARRNIKFDFENKEEILKLITKIEEKRNLLCYGKPQPEELISETIEIFNKLRKEFEKLGVNYEN